MSLGLRVFASIAVLCAALFGRLSMDVATSWNGSAAATRHETLNPAQQAAVARLISTHSKATL